MTYQTTETKEEARKGIQLDLFKVMEMARWSTQLMFPAKPIEDEARKEPQKYAWVLTKVAK